VSQVEQTHEEDPAAFPGNSPFTTSSLMESLEQVFNSMHTAGHNTFSGPPSQCDIPEVEQTHDEDQRMFAGKSSCSAPCFVASMEQEFHTMHTTMLNRLSGPDDISEVDHTNDEEQGMLPGNSSSTSSLVRSLKQAFNTMHTTRCDNHTSILLTGDSHHHMSELEQMHHNEQGVFSGDSKIMHPTRCDNHTSIMFGPDAEHHAREVEQAHDEDQGRFPGNFNFSTSSLAESLEQAFNTMHTMRNNRFSGSDPQQDIPQVEHMHDEHQKIFPGIPSCSAPALAETFEQALNTLHTTRFNRFTGTDSQLVSSEVDHTPDEKLLSWDSKCSTSSLVETLEEASSLLTQTHDSGMLSGPELQHDMAQAAQMHDKEQGKFLSSRSSGDINSKGNSSSTTVQSHTHEQSNKAVDLDIQEFGTVDGSLQTKSDDPHVED